MLRLTKPEWATLSGLLFLSFVPCVGGIIRLLELSIGFELMPENPRVHAVPLPVVIHLIGSVPYCLLGILQFLPSVRAMYPRWHRISGRMILAAGLVGAVSGLWMTHFYDLPVELQGPLLYWGRILVGFGMIIALYLGFSAVLKKQISTHRAWMLRAYAIGQGAGTQAIVGISWLLLFGEATGLARDILMTLAWVINLLVAEVVIRKAWGVDSQRAPSSSSPRLQYKKF